MSLDSGRAIFNAVLDADGQLLASNVSESYLRHALTSDPPEIERTGTPNVYRLRPKDLRVLTPTERRRRHLHRHRA